MSPLCSKPSVAPASPETSPSPHRGPHGPEAPGLESSDRVPASLTPAQSAQVHGLLCDSPLPTLMPTQVLPLLDTAPRLSSAVTAQSDLPNHLPETSPSISHSPCIPCAGYWPLASPCLSCVLLHLLRPPGGHPRPRLPQEQETESRVRESSEMNFSHLLHAGPRCWKQLQISTPTAPVRAALPRLKFNQVPMHHPSSHPFKPQTAGASPCGWYHPPWAPITQPHY